MKRLRDLKNRILKELSKRENFERAYNRGIDYYNKKMYLEALNCFNRAAEKPNAQPQVYYNLALSYQYLNNYDRAITTYNKFLSLRANDYDGLYNLALIYYRQEKYEKAVELFEKCLELKKDEDGIKALVLAYIGQKESHKAIELSEKLYNSDEPISLYYTIAKVFESKNSINKDYTFVDTAIEMYLKMLSTNPEDFDALLSLSISYAKKGAWESSVVFCEKAISKNPKSYEANNQMGLVHYCCNNIEAAIKYYETALKLKPSSDYRIYSNLAYAYEKQGERQKAINLFKKLLSKFPNCPAAEEIKNHMRILKASL